MTAYGEFNPTKEQVKIARAASEMLSQMMDRYAGCRFILPGQPEPQFTWETSIPPQTQAAQGVKTGRAKLETLPIIWNGQRDPKFMHVVTADDDFFVLEGRYIRVLPRPSNSDGVGQSDGSSDTYS